MDGIRHGSKAFAGPEHVVIDLTNRCGNSCIACWTRSPLLGENRPDPSWHRQELPKASLLRLIDDLGAMGTFNIRFSGGGDPLLYPDLPDAVVRVKSHGMYCAVTTGLPEFSADRIAEVISAGVDELAISLWASDRESYMQTHPGQNPEAFDRITSALSGVKRDRNPRWKIFHPARRPGSLSRLHFLNVICNRNYRSVESMYEFALKHGADSVYFTLVDTMKGSTDSLLLSGDERASVIRACERIREKNDLLPDAKRPTLDGFIDFERRLIEDSADDGHYDRGVVNRIPCYMGWVFCRILADGRVAPCCRGVHMPMGNINKDSFEEIWFSEKYDAFRLRARNAVKDPDFVEKIGCDQVCDNHRQNDDFHRMLESAAAGIFPSSGKDSS